MGMILGVALAVGLMVAGVVLCFAGYRTMRGALALVGFVSGFALAYALTFAWFGLGPIPAVIAGVVGGLVGAVLAGVLYAVGLFLAGCAFGLLLGTAASGLLPVDPLIIIPVCGLLSGILALAARKWILIVATAGVGSFLLVVGLSGCLSRPGLVGLHHFSQLGQWLHLGAGWVGLLWAAFFLIGLVVQWKTAGEAESENTDKESRSRRRRKRHE